MKKVVTVIQNIEVEVDETKFTPQFMEEFRSYMFSHFDTLDDHIRHIAQLHARGVIDASSSGEFIEGYGPIEEFGIKAQSIWCDAEKETGINV